MPRLARFAMPSLVVLSLSCPAVALQTIYVSPCGDDSATGYGANCATVPLFKPKRTIQAAINAATFPGDVVIVMPGTYNEVINFLGRAITVKSDQGPASTTISGAGLNSSVVRCVSGETVSSVFEGFTIRGGTGSEYGGFTRGGGIQIAGSSPTVRDCVFIDNVAWSGGGAAALNGNPRFLNCTFRNNTADVQGGGLTFDGSRGLVSHCIIDSNHSGTAGGVMLMGAEATPGEVAFLNCLVSRNATSGKGGGVAHWGGFASRFVGCTIALNTAATAGPAAYLPAPGSSFTNSILWGATTPQVEGAGGGVFTYCDARGGVPGEGNINVDPLFVNAAAGNFRLLGASPCIDAGDTPRAAAEFDLDQHDRTVNAPAAFDAGITYFGAVVDMGAYEFALPAPPLCPSDITHDGLVNGMDLGQLLASWGACP